MLFAKETKDWYATLRLQYLSQVTFCYRGFREEDQRIILKVVLLHCGVCFENRVVIRSSKQNHIFILNRE